MSVPSVGNSYIPTGTIKINTLIPGSPIRAWSIIDVEIVDFLRRQGSLVNLEFINIPLPRVLFPAIGSNFYSFVLLIAEATELSSLASYSG